MTWRGRLSTATAMLLVLQGCSAPSPQPTFLFGQQLGIAVFKIGAPEGCLAITNPSLAPGKPIVLAFINEREGSSTRDGRIVAKADSACDSKLAITVDAAPTFYRVLRLGDSTSVSAALAIVDPVAPITTRAGRPVGDLNGDGQLETFNSCTSTEGVHYRVWTGAVYEGRVRWHRYVYAGYDMVGSCRDLEFFVTNDTTRAIAPPRTPEPERDIIEMAKEHSLYMWVDGALAPYGDPALAKAIDRLADVPKPWTVPQMIRLFEETVEVQRREDLARLLAASNDPRAALTLGRTLDNKDSPGGGRIFDALFDYVVSDINYGLAPEQWTETVAGNAHDHTLPAVRRWWTANRPRLETLTKTVR